MLVEIDKVDIDVRAAENGYRAEVTCRGSEYHEWNFIGSTINELWAALSDKVAELLEEGVNEEGGPEK